MSNDERPTQPLCEQRSRKRHKLESNLAEQGLIECKLTDVGAGEVARAFYQFAANQKVDAPFVVQAAIGAVAAWPLQFHPKDIQSCGGFLRQGEESE